MESSLKSLAAKFESHRKAHRAAGGSLKGLRYPKQLRSEAAALARESGCLEEVTEALGLSPSGIRNWVKDKQFVPATTFMPVEVVTERPLKAPLRGVSLTVRDLTVTFGDEADEQMLARAVAQLMGRGGASC